MSSSATETSVSQPAQLREQARLQAVRALRLLDEPLGSGIGDVLRLAAEVCDSPAAVINIFGENEMHPFTERGVGLDPLERSTTLCEQVIQSRSEIITADARLEPRFVENPYVNGPLAQVRFYASMPLTTEQGDVVGTLCTYDNVTREISKNQVNVLRALAKQIMGIFELRAALAQSVAAATQLAQLAEQADEVLQTSMDAYYAVRSDCIVQAWNRAAEELLGYGADEAIGQDLRRLIVPERFQEIFMARLPTNSTTPVGIRRVVVHRKDGQELTADLMIWPSRSQPGWHVFARDVSESVAVDQKRAAAEERLRVAFEAAPLGIVVNDVSDPQNPVLVSSNSRFIEMVGHQLSEVHALGTSGLTHPDDVDRDADATIRLAQGTLDIYRTDKRFVHAEGHIIWGRLTASIARTGSTAYMICQVEDITSTRAAERARRQAESLLSIAFEHAPHGTAIIGVRGADHGRMLRVNPALIAMTRRENLVGGHLSSLLDRDVSEVLADFDRLAEGETELFQRVCQLRAGGGHIYAEASITLSRDVDGRPQHALAQLRDITQQHAHEKYLTRQAKTDTLTGLANRLAMRERLVSAIDSLRAGDGALGVLMIDLDRFKDVNDTLGHDAGDQLLRRVAKALVRTLPSTATAARLGGDEFIVIAPQQDASGMSDLVDRITDAINRVGADLDEHTGVKVTGSVGQAMTENPSTAPEDLIRAADQAMYQIKRTKTRST